MNLSTTPFQWEHDAYNNNYENCGLSGYTGLEYGAVAQLSRVPAVRAQLGKRGLYKSGLAVMTDGTLIASPVDMLAPQVSSPFPTGCVDTCWPVKLHKSSDGGHSWQSIEHTPLCGKEGSLTCLDDGALLFTSESLDGIGYSDNGGTSWELINFNTTREDEYQLIGPVRAPIFPGDGSIAFIRCIGTIEGQVLPPGYDSPKSKAWLMQSSDGGRTWQRGADVETWGDTFPLFIEADFEHLPDGRILAASRFEWLHPLKDKPLPYPPGTMPNDHAAGHMVLIESADNGLTWSAPREFLQYSEVQGQLTLLKDQRLLCTYTNYHLPFGVSGVLSYDYGRTWDFEHPLQLAVSNATSTGWATTRELPDGSLITIYALEPYHIEPPENGRTVCHTVRWELPPKTA